MKSKAWTACMVCVAVGFVLGSLSQPQLTGQEKAKEPPPVKWEYQVLAGGIENFNSAGDEGWELVAVDRLAYFKRAKR